MLADRLRRLGRLLPAPAGHSRLSLEVGRWLAINYWTADHFAMLTQACCPAAKALSETDVEAVVSGARPDLTPRFFQAFASVDTRIRIGGGRPLNSDQDLLALYSSSICMDQAATNASWWFALYCNEPWAIAKIVAAPTSPILDLHALRQRVPTLLRRAISERQRDPVSFLKNSVQGLHRGSRLKASSFIDWVLEYDQIDLNILRLAIPLALVLMSELGKDCTSIADLSIDQD